MKKKMVKTMMAAIGCATMLMGCTINAKNAPSEIDNTVSTNANTEAIDSVETSPKIEVKPTIEEKEQTKEDFGLFNATLKDVRSFIDNKETFVVLVDYLSDNEAFQINVKNALAQIENEYDILCNIYYVSSEDEQIEDFDFLIETLVESEDNDIEKAVDYLPQPYGVFTYKDGIFVQHLGEMDAIEDFGSLKEKIVDIIYSSLLFQNNHNLDLISYEQVLEKIENGDEFVLYIGRDSCIDCRIFMPSFEKVLSNYPPNKDVYYLNTQSYKSAIDAGEEDAQERWAALKETLGISGTPSLIYYNGDGDEIKFRGYADDLRAYLNLSEEEKKVAREDVADYLAQWFVTNKLFA